MKYHPKLKAAIIPMTHYEAVGFLLLDALVDIRQAYDLPLDKYKRVGLLDQSDHAQRNILDIAEALGIELGAKWGNEIDLRGREKN